MSVPLWTPSETRVKNSHMARFTAQAEELSSRRFRNYEDLHRWSVEYPEEFWPLVWRFSEVRGHEPWRTVLTDPGSMLNARWFEGATLNFAENLLRFNDNHLAIVAYSETAPRRQLTYAELQCGVGSFAASLRRLGVTCGDTVVAYLPNIPETVVSMLGAASFGAIWSSCSPDFGVPSVLERFGQIDPKVFIGIDGYTYHGKRIDCRERIREIVKGLPNLRHVIIVPFLSPTVSHADLPELGSNTMLHLMTDLVSYTGSHRPEFVPLPFAHPLSILYSSGTTGSPKCIIHSAGGTLIQHLKELLLHTDLRREDRIFYFTTCGWMMWNWLVSSLAIGATILLYDGSPFFPNGSVLFDLADAEGMTIFGTSAKYIATLQKAGLCPRRTHRLDGLRTLLSTGSPLIPELFDYIYTEVKSDLCLSSISGGTDIVSCFVLGNPMLPVYRGEIQSKGLGMKVEVFDEHGASVVGTPGELVCTAPFPAQPIGFWNDPERKRYRESYFSTYENVWRHGDWAEITPRGGIIIHGRSDAVLNPGGVRIGTAELYRVVEHFPEVLESLAVGQQWQGDERIILFLKLAPGKMLDDSLCEKIRQQIRSDLSPRHVPAKIITVTDIPRTVNGKISELAVKDAIHGRPVKNATALANPGALELFRNLSELKED